MLGVNKNTVLRAMRILRDEGLVEFRGGAAASRSPALLSRVRFKQEWKDLSVFAHSQGYRSDAVIAMDGGAPTAGVRGHSSLSPRIQQGRLSTTLRHVELSSAGASGDGRGRFAVVRVVPVDQRELQRHGTARHAVDATTTKTRTVADHQRCDSW